MEMEKFYVAPEVEVLLWKWKSFMWLRKWKFWKLAWREGSKEASLEQAKRKTSKG